MDIVEDYKIQKSVSLVLLTFLSYYILVIYYILYLEAIHFTSKVVTPEGKWTMTENTASWSETAQELDKVDNLE